MLSLLLLLQINLQSSSTAERERERSEVFTARSRPWWSCCILKKILNKLVVKRFEISDAGWQNATKSEKLIYYIFLAPNDEKPMCLQRIATIFWCFCYFLQCADECKQNNLEPVEITLNQKCLVHNWPYIQKKENL